jgi:hypothetical protein
VDGGTTQQHGGGAIEQQTDCRGKAVAALGQDSGQCQAAIDPPNGMPGVLVVGCRGTSGGVEEQRKGHLASTQIPPVGAKLISTSLFCCGLGSWAS